MSFNKVKLNIVSHGFHYKCDFSDANRQQINEWIVKNEIIKTKSYRKYTTACTNDIRTQQSTSWLEKRTNGKPGKFWIIFLVKMMKTNLVKQA